MKLTTTSLVDYPTRIANSGLTIYDAIDVGSALWIPSDALERLLQDRLAGSTFGHVALRTRSKIAKQMVCTAMGYPVPKSFARGRPRFPGQNFDTYVQGANNLQIWNEEISPARRYVLIRPDSAGVIRRVRVVTGVDLAPFDTTGKLTRKFQARVGDPAITRLASPADTPNLIHSIGLYRKVPKSVLPSAYPDPAYLIPIGRLFDLLRPLVGRTFTDPGILQERNRGAVLHGMVATALGYRRQNDNGKFPDIRHQLLEVKLQTSPTIDLGAISPDSMERLDYPAVGSIGVLHRDVRYAVFCGENSQGCIRLIGLTMVTGSGFFATFERFAGMAANKKVQLHLPGGFFDRNTEGVFY